MRPRKSQDAIAPEALAIAAGRCEALGEAPVVEVAVLLQFDENLRHVAGFRGLSEQLSAKLRNGIGPSGEHTEGVIPESLGVQFLVSSSRHQRAILRKRKPVRKTHSILARCFAAAPGWMC